MGKRETERRRLSRCVLVRMTPALERATVILADERGLSCAAYLRSFAVAAAMLSRSERRPTRPVPRRPPPRADVAELARLAGAVGKSAGAAVQLAKTLREAGAADLHSEAELVLAELRASQRALVDLTERLRRAIEEERP